MSCRQSGAPVEAASLLQEGIARPVPTIYHIYDVRYIHCLYGTIVLCSSVCKSTIGIVFNAVTIHESLNFHRRVFTAVPASNSLL